MNKLSYSKNISTVAFFPATSTTKYIAITKLYSMADRPDCPSYKLVGDKIDKGVKARYMRADKYHNKSLHYFHSYAMASRIDFSKFSNVKPATCLNSPPKECSSSYLQRKMTKQFHYSGIKGACGKHSFLLRNI